MADIAVDFTNTHEKGGNYEPGTYSFEVADAELKQGPKGPYIKLGLQFTEGKYAGLYTEEMVSLSEDALWRAMVFLKAIGYEVPKGPFRFRTEDLLQLRFRAECTREVDPTGKYPPKLRLQTFINGNGSPAPESGSAPVPATDAVPASATASHSAPVATATPAPAVPAGPVAARPKVKV